MYTDNENNFEIKDIEDEFSLISELFSELNKEVFNQQKKIESIEDYIANSKTEIKTSEEEHLIDARKDYLNSYSKLYLNRCTPTFLGAGLGSILVLYNPYVGIWSTILGGLSGYYFNYFHEKFISDVENKSEEHKD